MFVLKWFFFKSCCFPVVISAKQMWHLGLKGFKLILMAQSCCYSCSTESSPAVEWDSLCKEQRITWEERSCPHCQWWDLAVGFREKVHLVPSPTWLVLRNWKNTVGHINWPNTSLFPAAHSHSYAHRMLLQNWVREWQEHGLHPWKYLQDNSFS